MRSLVVHSGGIGDLILTLPALEVLGGDGPVSIAGIPERAALALRSGIVESVYSLDAIQFHTLFSEPTDALRAFFADFDRVVVFMRDDAALRDGLRACGVTNGIVRAGVPPKDWAHHASRWYLEAVGVEEERGSRMAWPTMADEGLDVVIAPGSGGVAKNWPIANYIGLSERLMGVGRSVAWLLGPAEEGMVVPEGARILETTTVCDAADVLAGATDFVGNDSGMTHLAAAVGTQTTAIFGPTNPHVWAPLGTHVAVACGNGWPTVEEVFDLVRRP